MNRRQAASRILALGGITFLSPALLQACREAEEKPTQGLVLRPEQIRALEEFADALLPDTSDSPGAKAAGCGPDMAEIIKNCLTPKEGKGYAALLESFGKSAKARFSRPFTALTHAEKVNILTPFDQAREEVYVKLKELAVFVYFTSETGMTQALRYIEVPARLDGCMPLEKGDKSWAWSFP